MQKFAPNKQISAFLLSNLIFFSTFAITKLIKL